MTEQGKRLMEGMELGSRPRRKQGGSWIAIAAFFLAILGAAGGGYFLHQHFGADATVTPPDPATETAAATPAAGTSERAQTNGAEAAEPVALTLTTTTSTRPVPIRTAPDTTPTAATEPTTPVRASTTTTPTGSPPPPTTPETEMARQILRDADTLMKNRNYAEAKSTLQDFLTKDYPATYKAAGYYRLGLVGRYSKEERLAQSAWNKAFEDFPQTRWGRMSALALADTWFAWYASTNPKYEKWEAIRNAYSTAMGMDGARFLDKKTSDRVAGNLMYLNEKLVFDPATKVTGAYFHRVKSGQTMSTIARDYGLDTWTSIAQINKIKPRNIRVGMKLKVMTGRLSVVVDRRDLTLTWYLDGKWIKRYACCIAAGDKTKPGNYRINVMSVEPTWTHPDTGEQIKFGDPRHAIGTRWLAMEGMGTSGLGIHGTNDPASIPGRVSMGCIRLTNQHVEELYGFASIQPGNETEVYIID